MSQQRPTPTVFSHTIASNFVCLTVICAHLFPQFVPSTLTPALNLLLYAHIISQVVCLQVHNFASFCPISISRDSIIVYYYPLSQSPLCAHTLTYALAVKPHTSLLRCSCAALCLHPSYFKFLLAIYIQIMATILHISTSSKSRNYSFDLHCPSFKLRKLLIHTSP